MDPQIIHELSHLLRLRFRPVEVGRIELDALISELSNGTDRAFQVQLKRFANRIELQTNGNGRGRARLKRPRKHRGQGKKRSAGKSHARNRTPESLEFHLPGRPPRMRIHSPVTVVTARCSVSP